MPHADKNSSRFATVAAVAALNDVQLKKPPAGQCRGPAPAGQSEDGVCSLSRKGIISIGRSGQEVLLHADRADPTAHFARYELRAVRSAEADTRGQTVEG